jgi:hypothetical protein
VLSRAVRIAVPKSARIATLSGVDRLPPASVVEEERPSDARNRECPEGTLSSISARDSSTTRRDRDSMLRFLVCRLTRDNRGATHGRLEPLMIRASVAFQDGSTRSVDLAGYSTP